MPAKFGEQNRGGRPRVFSPISDFDFLSLVQAGRTIPLIGGGPPYSNSGVPIGKSTLLLVGPGDRRLTAPVTSSYRFRRVDPMEFLSRCRLKGLIICFNSERTVSRLAYDPRLAAFRRPRPFAGALRRARSDRGRKHRRRTA